MTFYAALDVGVRSLALCIVDENGEVRLEKSLPSDVDERSRAACVASVKRLKQSALKPARSPSGLLGVCARRACGRW